VLLHSLGKKIQAHRLRRGLSQKGLAQVSNFSKSKICRIEIGKYPSLTVHHLALLAESLNLDLAISFYKRGVMSQTCTGRLEHHPETPQSSAHSCGTGISILWQKGALLADCDRNGATVEDVIRAAIKRLEEYQSGDFRCEENNIAIELLNKSIQSLERRMHGLSQSQLRP
jgi:DNA-binding XRE family transcriptional regulator